MTSIVHGVMGEDRGRGGRGGRGGRSRAQIMRRVAHLILTSAAALLVDSTLAYCPKSVMASCGRGAFVAGSRHGTNRHGGCRRGSSSSSSSLGLGRCGQLCTTGLDGVGRERRRLGAMKMSSSQGGEAGPRKCKVYDVRGELVPYTEALAWQKSLQSDRIKFKQAKQKGGDGGVGEQDTDALVLVEHPTVYTLGSSSEMSHILFPLDEASIAKVGDVVSVEGQDGGFDVHRVQRGGKITYHCPGQLVGYPILDLACHQQDIGWYLREVEGVVIDALASFGVEATTIEGLTGVWVDGSKIAAIGVGASRWVTMHGFALNVDPECKMAGFRRIVPCGIEDREVTSMKEVMGDTCPGMDAVRDSVKEAFSNRFGLVLASASGSPQILA